MRDDSISIFHFLNDLKTTEDTANSFMDMLKNNPSVLHEGISSFDIIKFISNFVKISEKDSFRVLDPACGSGSLLAYISMLCKSSEAIGFDINSQIISEASKLFPDLDLHLGNTSKELILEQKVDLIISDLPIRVRLEEPVYIDEQNKIMMAGDAIVLNSLQQLSDNGMAIFLMGPSILSRRDSSLMIEKLEGTGIYLNALISIERPRPSISKTNRTMLIFSKKECENIFFSGCNLSEGEYISELFLSKNTDGPNHKWAPREKFIGFGENNMPLIDDVPIHKENLQISLKSASSLYEYQTLGDIMLDYKFCKGEKTSDINIARNPLYIRRSNPISTTDLDEVKNWKHGFFIIQLDDSKVKNEYLEYLFSRTVGRYMMDTITTGNVIKSIRSDRLKIMPLLLPSLDIQDTVLSIRKQIEIKNNDLQKMKNMLNDLVNLDRIKIQIDELSGEATTVDSLIFKEESSRLEFKSSLWTEMKNDLPNEDQKNKFKPLEDSVIKTICAFLNSEGGTLLIGVSDNKLGNGKSKIIGIEHDYKWCKENNMNSDGFGQAIESIIKDKLSSQITSLSKHISKSFHEIDGKTICKIDVKAAPRNGHGYAVRARISSEKTNRFFIRSGETTAMQSPESAINYIMTHFVGIDDDE